VTALNQNLSYAKHFPRSCHAFDYFFNRHGVGLFVPGRSVERAKLAVGHTDVGVIQDDVVDESNSIAKPLLPQQVRDKAH
jgi:hypothetical protein